MILWYNLLMIRNFTYQITDEQNNTTIQRFLRTHGYSQNVIVHLKKTPESILKNGTWSYVNDRLNTGDVLEIKLIENEGSPKIVPVDMPLDIVYEDDDIIVLNKPANTPIHPSLNNYENTLANAVMHYYHAQGIPYTFRCITRLDRDTTGLTLLAKHMLSASVLSVAMQKHAFVKEYMAICEGIIPVDGTIDAPIARASESAIERCVDYERGESACTHFTRMNTFQKNSQDLSLLRLRLETGRTHQIRVHMQHIGHPLIGDFLYNPNNHLMNRQALHCCHLEFDHPITGEHLSFELDLPKDMKTVSATERF